MAASIVVIGHEISPAPGGWLQPPRIASGGVSVPGDAIPIASLAGGQAEASVLLVFGNATIVAP